MRLLEGVVLSKAFLFAVLLLAGLSPPDSSGAVKCYSCTYDSTKNDTEKDGNCFEGGVPIPALGSSNEMDCVGPNYDDKRCCTELRFGFPPNEYRFTKGCLDKPDIDCWESLNLSKNEDDCYLMTRDEYLNYTLQCGPASGRKRRSLGYDGTGNPRLGKRQATPETSVFCICTGDHCGEYAPESIYQAAGLTKPPSPGGGGGSGGGGSGGGSGGGGKGSGTTSLQVPKWTNVVKWTVITLAFAAIGIHD